jgi:hypothetical protein
MRRKHRRSNIRNGNIYVTPDVVPVLFAVKGQLEADLFQGVELFEIEAPIAEEIHAYYARLLKGPSVDEIQIVPMVVRMMYLGEVFRDLLDKFLIEGIAMGLDPGKLKMPIPEESEQWEWYSDMVGEEVWSYATFGIPFLTIRTRPPSEIRATEPVLRLPLQAPSKIVTLVRLAVAAPQSVAIAVGGRPYDFRSDFAEIYSHLLAFISEQEGG